MRLLFVFALLAAALGLVLFFKGGTMQYIGALFFACGIFMFDIIHEERKSQRSKDRSNS